jgi:hypothetical protein
MCKLLKNIEEFKKDYDILSINDICKKHGIKNPKTIWAYAKKLNINRPKGTKRKYQVNDDYFSICSNNMYYILGLIYTDGNLPKNSNSFIISNTDKDLLEKIKIELNYNGNIFTEYHKIHNKYIYKLCITSNKMRKDLENFGLTPNKTFDLNFPEIPEIYLKDFIRGLWDGDGSVSNPLTKQKTKILLVSSFVCANYNFINRLNEILPTNVKSKIHQRHRKNTLYNITYRAFSSIKIRNFMYYDNCLCIERKKQLFFNYEPKRSETIIHKSEKIKG